MLKPNSVSKKRPWSYRVIKSYQCVYPDPIKLKKGDRLKIDPNKKADWKGWLWCTTKAGKSGWVPKKYIEYKVDTGTTLCDYDATELTVEIGNKIKVLEVESGWLWCIDQNGKKGWIPENNAKRIKP